MRVRPCGGRCRPRDTNRAIVRASEYAAERAAEHFREDGWLFASARSSRKDPHPSVPARCTAEFPHRAVLRGPLRAPGVWLRRAALCLSFPLPGLLLLESLLPPSEAARFLPVPRVPPCSTRATPRAARRFARRLYSVRSTPASILRRARNSLHRRRRR